MIQLKEVISARICIDGKSSRALVAIICSSNYDLRSGLEVYCYQETLLVQGARDPPPPYTLR